MNQGKYKISQQIETRGLFASIEIYAEFTQSYNIVQIECEIPIESEWKSGIEFGASYFLQHMKALNKHTKGINIIVKKFDGNDVDTTPILVSIVTIKALMDALKVDIYKEPFIDTEKFVYCFPF